jgi:hypothetical protein
MSQKFQNGESWLQKMLPSGVTSKKNAMLHIQIPLSTALDAVIVLTSSWSQRTEHSWFSVRGCLETHFMSLKEEAELIQRWRYIGDSGVHMRCLPGGRRNHLT